MVRFKIVRHKGRYHVIGYEGVKNPKKVGAEPTYKEQCISSHWTLNNAQSKKASYETIKLKLTNKLELTFWGKVKRELPLGLPIAIGLAVAAEIMLKLYKGGI